MGIFSKAEKAKDQDPEKSDLELAMEAGAARREKITNSFRGIGKAMGKGVDFLLGSPTLAKAKVEKAGEAMSSAAQRAWEKTTQGVSRFAERVDGARDAFSDKVDRGREKTTAKIEELSGRVSDFTREKVVAPVKNRIEAARDRVDSFKTAFAAGREARANEKEATAKRREEYEASSRMEGHEARIAQLREEIARAQEGYTTEAQLRERAGEEASVLEAQAEEARRRQAEAKDRSSDVEELEEA